MRRFTRGAAASGAVALLGLALQSAGPLASASCDGHECDPHWVDYGCPANGANPPDCCDQGVMLDDDHWATTLESVDWLPFQSYEHLRLHIGAWTGSRMPDEGLSGIWISPGNSGDPDAPLPLMDPTDAPVGATTLATGNLGEFEKVVPGLVEVLNATCSPQRVRVVIGFPSPEGGVVTQDMKGPCRHTTSTMDAAHGGGG